MNTPYIAEFRKRLSAAHKRKISNSLRKRNKEPFDSGEALDKAILRTTHIANSTNNLTKAYYNVARGAKDFQLVRKYRRQMNPSSLRRVGGFLDSGLRRGDVTSRIGSRISSSRTGRMGVLGRIASANRGLDIRDQGLVLRSRGLDLTAQALQLRKARSSK